MSQLNPGQEFLAHLLELMQKYDVRLDKLDNYDSDERYRGSEYEFISAYDPKTGVHDICLTMNDIRRAQKQRRLRSEGN